MKRLIALLVVWSLVAQACFSAAEESQLPNIVIMMADDMGYGEVQHLNPEHGKIKTPCLDALAAGGIVFTDAHSGSAVCTPTRYGLMTGRYAWRTRLQRGVLKGGESLIDADRLTIAKMLKTKSYHTACVGKWHLGMLFDGVKNPGKVPIGSRVTHGPIDRGGFDQFFGFHHAGQMNLIVNNDVVTQHVEPIEMLPKLTEAAVAYVNGRRGKSEPFFLYVPWNSPHNPIVPTERWQGRSGLNKHADFVMQTDDSYGRVIDALKENGFFENTLIICTADNGTAGPSAKMAQLKRMGHYSSANLRGSKADIWDGGHRVPFIVSWPKVIEPGRRSDQLACHTDIIATVAEITGCEYPETALEDSYSFLPALKDTGRCKRTSVIHHSSTGRFAIRDGDWKLILCAGSGGWSAPKDKQALNNGAPKWQLYNMKIDLAEESNQFPANQQATGQLYQLLQQQVADGRSTPGKIMQNDVKVDIEKSVRQ